MKEPIRPAQLYQLAIKGAGVTAGDLARSSTKAYLGAARWLAESAWTRSNATNMDAKKAFELLKEAESKAIDTK